MMDWDVLLIKLLAEEEEEEFIKRRIIVERRKRRFWVNKIWQSRCVDGEFHKLCIHLKGVKFYDYYKMDYQKLKKLVDLIRPHVEKRKSKFRSTISIEERLTVCLRFLTTGTSFKALSFNYRMGYSTIRSIVHETCAAIWKILRPIVMPKPTEVLWKAVEEDFKNIWNFPNCIGAIDGKHIRIRAPIKSGSQYFNYKKFFSTVLLAVVDAKYRFVIVDIGAYGRNSDGGIMSHSKLGQKMQGNRLNIPRNKTLPGTNQVLPHVFVADEAFALTENIMRPYPGNQIEGDRKKKMFNYRLSRARRMVESAFGILRQKFEIFDISLRIQPKYLDNIILACTCLHNYIIDGENLRYEDVINNSSNSTIFENINDISHDEDSALLPRTTREKFKDYFSEEGCVNWQNDIIDRC
ncbi:protein ANTAGONIST OF LIKE HETEROCHROMATIN PROTEIN 1-like isoform X2 [Pararge aegeria]|uniref:protein ANTAGONIST OF LIKE HETEROCHROMATIN PROTEIN 1-like isoform X2 n=1 Tax=Pararge aegeria TaxID=116150 RepID=UPI0019D10453|nr:protein ANTAGONIST OF LIKE HETEROCHROMATIN PROTEIN 1-like isoform X2 [Pararge aegeria]